MSQVMPSFPKNISLDGTTLQFQVDSPVLVFFDPELLDGLRDLLPPGVPVDVAGVLERANAGFPAMACYTIPDFRPGLFTLDPRDVKKFGYEDEDLDYGADVQAHTEPDDEASSWPFVGVDSGAIIVVDATHVADLVNRLSWEQYNLGLEDQAVFGRIADALGGAFFAVVLGAGAPDMEFDGDGTYTIPVGCVRPKVG
jgi:hypothetical protein